MHMTLETDHAVKIVDFLAASNQEVDVRSISEGTCVPPRFAPRILRKLVSDGIVRFYRGAHGDYTLARPGSQITLREVIESVEGLCMISRCQQDEYACTYQACRYHRIYTEISESVCRQLDSYTSPQAEPCGAACRSVKEQEKGKVEGCPGVDKQLPRCRRGKIKNIMASLYRRCHVEKGKELSDTVLFPLSVKHPLAMPANRKRVSDWQKSERERSQKLFNTLSTVCCNLY